MRPSFGFGVGIGIEYRLNANFNRDPIPIAIPTPKILHNAACILLPVDAIRGKRGRVDGHLNVGYDVRLIPLPRAEHREYGRSASELASLRQPMRFFRPYSRCSARDKGKNLNPQQIDQTSLRGLAEASRFFRRSLTFRPFPASGRIRLRPPGEPPRGHR